MIPRFRPHYNWREMAASMALWRSSSIHQFEQRFAEKFGFKHALAFPYGRTALIAQLNALGLKNRTIICPTYTCVVVAHAIKYSGNEPLFLDSQESDFNMNLELVTEKISDRVGAIVATSIFGSPVNLDQLKTLTQKFPNVPVIQDCCHSFDCKWNGQSVAQAGISSFFAMNISKIINSVFGGMVLTNDAKFAEQLEIERQRLVRKGSWLKSLKSFLYIFAATVAFTDFVYGLVLAISRTGVLGKLVKYYDDSLIDMPGDYQEQMTPLQARVGLVQLEKYDAILAIRQQCAEIYYSELAKIKELSLPPRVPGATFSHFVVRTNQARFCIEELEKRGIQLGEIIEYTVGDLKAYAGTATNHYPVARKFVGNTINLPLGKVSDASTTVAALKQILPAPMPK